MVELNLVEIDLGEMNLNLVEMNVVEIDLVGMDLNLVEMDLAARVLRLTGAGRHWHLAVCRACAWAQAFLGWGHAVEDRATRCRCNILIYI